MTTVYTLVPEGGHNPWFRSCVESAHGQGTHRILNVPNGGFFAARKRVYTNDGKRTGYVACLDWDDLLMPGAVRACEQALRRYSAGCAFTWQNKIDEAGTILSEQTNLVTRLDVSSVPESIHHLCLIDSARIPLDVFDLIERVAPLCVDWLVRAYVALRFEAIQIPRLGYSWRMHGAQTTRVMERTFTQQIPLARALARSWAPLSASKLHGNFTLIQDANLPVP